MGLILYLPIDIIKYFTSLYYKNTKERYYLFGALSSYFKLYNIIKRNNLPIAFYRNKILNINSYGYFVYKNILILTDYNMIYNEDNKEFTYDIDNDSIRFDSDIVKEELKECNECIGSEICNYAIVFIEYNDIKADVQLEFENYRFMLVDEKNIMVSLNEIVEKY